MRRIFADTLDRQNLTGVAYQSLARRKMVVMIALKPIEHRFGASDGELCA